MTNKRIFLENSMYAVLGILVIAQCVVGESFYLGQGLFLLGNIVKTIRTFALRRPKAEKVTDIAFTAITIGIILIRLVR
jgi:hypothetical protein